MRDNSKFREKHEAPFKVRAYSDLLQQSDNNIPGSYNCDSKSNDVLSNILHLKTRTPTLGAEISKATKAAVQMPDEESGQKPNEAGPVNGGDKPTDQSDKVPDKNGVDCMDGLCVLTKPRDPIPEQPKARSKWKNPDKEIFRPFLEAMEDFAMVKDGDRVLVCLSGNITKSSSNSLKLLV